MSLLAAAHKINVQNLTAIFATVRFVCGLFFLADYGLDFCGNPGVELDFTLISTKCLDFPIHRNFPFIDIHPKGLFNFLGNLLGRHGPE